mmetsp:Transcript_80952/g.179942  ORF Transcript_80952/g.179942 Transcript_80952/m.179942 type:complete len:80 (-) Transcript_80952:1991-2230(-)
MQADSPRLVCFVASLRCERNPQPDAWLSLPSFHCCGPPSGALPNLVAFWVLRIAPFECGGIGNGNTPSCSADPKPGSVG